jgi:hypothetical protein
LRGCGGGEFEKGGRARWSVYVDWWGSVSCNSLTYGKISIEGLDGGREGKVRGEREREVEVERELTIKHHLARRISNIPMPWLVYNHTDHSSISCQSRFQCYSRYSVCSQTPLAHPILS